jgi:hypothetical protein
MRPLFVGIGGASVGTVVGFLTGGRDGAIIGLVVGGVLPVLVYCVGAYDRARALAACSELESRIKATFMESCRSKVGASADEMAQDRAEAERQLDNADPKIRRVALSILDFLWEARGEPGFADKCEQIAIGDTDSDVRANALGIMGLCYENTRDRRVGKLLAQVVLDESQPLSPRTQAYTALFYLRRRRPLFKSARVFQVPEDVDWQFVKSFID